MKSDANAVEVSSSTNMLLQTSRFVVALCSSHRAVHFRGCLAFGCLLLHFCLAGDF